MNRIKELENMLYNYRGSICKVKNICIDMEYFEGNEEELKEIKGLKYSIENEIKTIDEALLLLTEDELKLIQLHYFKRIKYKDIGVKLNMSPKNCCISKKKILNKLISIVFVGELIFEKVNKGI